MQELMESAPRQDNFGTSEGVFDDSGDAFTSPSPSVAAVAAQRRVEGGEGEVNQMNQLLLMSLPSSRS